MVAHIRTDGRLSAPMCMYPALRVAAVQLSMMERENNRVVGPQIQISAGMSEGKQQEQCSTQLSYRNTKTKQENQLAQ